MAAYGQRTDLNMAATAVPGQTYGEAGKQIAAQKAVPMGAPVAPTATQPGIAPGAFGPLDRPTERPMEPATAGNPMGLGAGMEALPPAMPASLQPGSREDLINQVRYVYSKFPNSAVFQLLLELENQPI
jgi:hypothetical protein